MKENIIKLQKLISEHSNTEVYFEDYFDADSIIPRVVYNIKYIKEGYLFEGCIFESLVDFEMALYESAENDGRAFNNELFKEDINNYYLKHNVEDFEELDDNADELISILASKVQSKEFILVTLKPIDY